MSDEGANAASVYLQRAVDPDRDHTRGGGADDVVSLVVYGDYLCPYCRRLRFVLAQLRSALGESLIYVFRHLPNERVHPGAEMLARATEAAAAPGRVWEMADWLYGQEPPIGEDRVLAFAQSLGLDVDRFRHDFVSDAA